jgi:hypothetical protein
MKKFIVMALVASVLPALAMAADFSGTYTRDAKASTPTSYPVYWITRDPPAPGGFGGQAQIVLKQTPAALQITDPARAIRNIPLDGKPHVGKHETGLVDETVTAAVQGDTIVVTTVAPYSGLPGSIVTPVKATWSLSPDGKTLTVTSVTSTPALPAVTSKQVYTKQ